MKRILALVSVAALLLVGLAVNNSGSDDPVFSSSGEPAAIADGDLASLGPLSLITDFYGQNFEKPCSRGNGSGAVNQCTGVVSSITQAGFDFSTATCLVGAVSFNALFAPAVYNSCSAAQTGATGKVTYDFNFTVFPCDGLVFATITLTDGGGNTLPISITESNNEAC